MSLSDAPKNDSGAWGTIFSQGREHTLGNMESSRSTAWSADDEADYLERIKEKAMSMASGIVAEARQEAIHIKDEAREQGHAEGMAAAQEELDNFRAGMTETVSAVLTSIEGQCSHIFDEWREDILGVCRLAVESITGISLKEDRRAILDRLLLDSIALLEKRREIIIRVNPEDEEVLNEIVGSTQERFPDVTAWRVRADADVSPGGMVVESESSLAEGRIESRAAAVNEIMNSLTLPEKL